MGYLWRKEFHYCIQFSLGNKSLFTKVRASSQYYYTHDSRPNFTVMLLMKTLHESVALGMVKRREDQLCTNIQTQAILLSTRPKPLTPADSINTKARSGEGLTERVGGKVCNPGRGARTSKKSSSLWRGPYGISWGQWRISIFISYISFTNRLQGAYSGSKTQGDII